MSWLLDEQWNGQQQESNGFSLIDNLFGAGTRARFEQGRRRQNQELDDFQIDWRRRMLREESGPIPVQRPVSDAEWGVIEDEIRQQYPGIRLTQDARKELEETRQNRRTQSAQSLAQEMSRGVADNAAFRPAFQMDQQQWDNLENVYRFRTNNEGTPESMAAFREAYTHLSNANYLRSLIDDHNRAGGDAVDTAYWTIDRAGIAPLLRANPVTGWGALLVSGIGDVTRRNQINAAVERMEAGNPTDFDMQVLMRFIAANERAHGAEIGKRLFDTATHIAAYAGQFRFNFQQAARIPVLGPRAAARSAAAQNSNVLGRTWAATPQALLATPFSAPERTAEMDTSRAMVGSDEDGNAQFSGERPKYFGGFPGSTVLAGTASAAIENWTETAGGELISGLGRSLRGAITRLPVPQRARAVAETIGNWARLNPGQGARVFLQRTDAALRRNLGQQYHGFFTELGEERLSEMLHGAAQIGDWGITGKLASGDLAGAASAQIEEAAAFGLFVLAGGQAARWGQRSDGRRDNPPSPQDAQNAANTVLDAVRQQSQPRVDQQLPPGARQGGQAYGQTQALPPMQEEQQPPPPAQQQAAPQQPEPAAPQPAPPAPQAEQAPPQTAPPPAAPQSQPADQFARIDQQQRDFIDGRVRQLGSTEAVRRTYSDNSVVSQYANMRAQELFGQQAQPTAPQPSTSQSLDHLTLLAEIEKIKTYPELVAFFQTHDPATIPSHVMFRGFTDQQVEQAQAAARINNAAFGRPGAPPAAEQAPPAESPPAAPPQTQQPEAKPQPDRLAEIAGRRFDAERMANFLENILEGEKPFGELVSRVNKQRMRYGQSALHPEELQPFVDEMVAQGRIEDAGDGSYVKAEAEPTAEEQAEIEARVAQVRAERQTREQARQRQDLEDTARAALARAPQSPAAEPAPAEQAAETPPAEQPAAPESKPAKKPRKPRKSRAKPEAVLYRAVLAHGGLNEAKVARDRGKSSIEEDFGHPKQKGTLRGLFRPDATNGLDEMADLLEREGHFQTPEGMNSDDYLLELLQQRKLSMQSNVAEDEIAKAEREYYEAQEAARRAGYSAPAVEESVRSGEESEAPGESDGRSKPGDGGVGGVAEGERDQERFLTKRSADFVLESFEAKDPEGPEFAALLRELYTNGGISYGRFVDAIHRLAANRNAVDAAMAALEAEIEEAAFARSDADESGGTGEVATFDPAEFESVDKILSETDAGPTAANAPGMFGNFLLGHTQGGRQDTIPSELRAENAEVERRLQQAEGLKRQPLLDKLRQWSAAAWKGLTRAHYHVPNTTQFDSAREIFRMLKAIPQTAQDKANRMVLAITNKLGGAKQMRLFSRKVLIDNLAASVEAGQPLRFGFTAEEVAAYKQKIDELVAQTPAVQEALAMRKRLLRAHVQELVERKLLNPKVLDNVDTYYHQQVNAKLELLRQSQGHRLKRKERTFQRSRLEGVESLPEEYDYNSLYIESEHSWLTDSLTEIEKDKWEKRLAEVYDIFPRERAAGKKLNEILRDNPDHKTWTPAPGQQLYPSTSVAEQIAEELERQLLEMGQEGGELTEEDMEAALAMLEKGGRFRIYPREIVDQLNSMVKEAPGEISQFLTKLMGWWKQWTLLNPKRFFAYNLRNVTGDLDPVVGGATGVFRYVAESAKELHGYYLGEASSLSDDVRLARDLAVIDSSLTASQIPDVRELPVFYRFFETADKKNLAQRVASAPAAWFQFTKKYTAYREAVLRLAAFKYYRRALGSGTLAHFGGARQSTVRQLSRELGKDVAAAHLARNLLGDYGNMTVFGNWLREHLVPFHAWNEVNFKRFPRLVENAVRYGINKGKDNPAAVGAYAAMGLMGVGALTAATYLFNMLFAPDDDDELDPLTRATPHLTLGRNADGSIVVFRDFGATGHLMRWFGLDHVIANFPKWQNGQLSMGDLLAEQAQGVANQAAQGLRPDLKAPFEIGGGLTFYPNIFEPRQQDRLQAAGNVLGLGQEAVFLRGQIMGTGELGKSGYWQRFFGATTQDPRRNNLGQIYELIERFEAQTGRSLARPMLPASTINPMREAALADDFPAFVTARSRFIEDGRTLESYNQSLANLDPLSRLDKDDEAKFLEFLTPQQLQDLEVARTFAQETKVKMWLWWHMAAQQSGNQAQREEASQNAGSVLIQATAPRPDRQPRETTDHYNRRVSEWTATVERARNSLSRLNLSRQEHLGLLRAEWLRRGLNPGSPSFAERVRRLR